MNDIHLMIDLETAGVSKNAALLSIGAVLFTKQGVTISEYYSRINLETDHGGKIDPSTFIWWLQQSEEARKTITEDKGEQMFVVIDDFCAWVRDFSPVDLKDVKVWGNGATFDIVILQEAFNRVGRTWPFSFWNERCFRTLAAEFPQVKRVKPELAHHALSDAKAQVTTLLNIWGTYGEE